MERKVVWLLQKQIGLKYQLLIGVMMLKHRRQSNWRYRMQVAQSVVMAASKLFTVMQLFTDLEKNNISKAGCRWLSKADWK